MLRPSYSDLLEVLNKEADKDNIIGSRYTIVIAVSKRARQLVDHAEPLTTKVKIDKPVSIAVNELFEGKIKISQNIDALVEEVAKTFDDMNEITMEEMNQSEGE